MSMTGLPVFDTTLQKTNLWLHELMEDLDMDDRHRAYQALRGVLHVLRDHLPLAQAAHLGSQLPMLIRGFYFEGWRPTAQNTKAHSPDKFLEAVAEYFPNDPEIDAERIVRSVFALLASHLPGGEIEKITGVLPKRLRHFWHEYHLQA